VLKKKKKRGKKNEISTGSSGIERDRVGSSGREGDRSGGTGRATAAHHNAHRASSCPASEIDVIDDRIEETSAGGSQSTRGLELNYNGRGPASVV
jgi:hypothetical protein